MNPAGAGPARGGKSIYGAPLGILMLEARFARIPGDMGNAGTWPFPVLYRVVAGARPDKVVLGGAAGLLPAFVAAGRELVNQGAEAIITNCGFLSLFQHELARQLQVPVATSAMMQVPWVQALLPPGKRVGVVTVSKAALTPAHLAGACVRGFSDESFLAQADRRPCLTRCARLRLARRDRHHGACLMSSTP